MANYVWNGNCVSEVALLSEDGRDFAPVFLDADSVFLFDRHTTVTPAVGDDTLTMRFIVRNLTTGLTESSLSHGMFVTECTTLGPIDAEVAGIYDQMTPQLAGAMSLATAVLWGGAWAWRITRALS